MSDASGGRPGGHRAESAFALNVARVRRERRFEVYLVEYERRRRNLDETPESFAEVHHRRLRPLLERVDRCVVFPPAGDSMPPAGLLAQWEGVGAQPEEWRARYLSEVTGRLEIALRGPVLDDVLFWWWMFPGGAPLWPVLLGSEDRLNPAEYFARVSDPTCVMNAYRGPSGRLLKWAKQETKQEARVAFIVRGNLSLSVVAGSKTTERLFRTALECATSNF